MNGLKFLLVALVVLFLGQGTRSAEATPCARGTFSPTGGQEPCQDADVGSYVDQEGQQFAFQAPAGYFVAQTGESLPSPVSGGHFAAMPGQMSGTACQAGFASRAGAVQCGAVAEGVPQSLAPVFNSSLGTGGSINVLPPTSSGGITDKISISLVISNDAVDYGLEGALSSDLTLISFAFRGLNAELFDLEGFTSGMVIGEEESVELMITVPSYMLPGGGFSALSVDLTIRTDQGNAFGFDPATSGFDPVAVEESYAFYRDNPPTSGQALPLSSEFTFNISVVEPGTLSIFGLGAMAVVFLRRRLLHPATG